MHVGWLFNASSIVEALVGVGLVLAPALVIGLLLGVGVGAIGVVVARVLGIALLSIGVAAWEAPQREVRLAPRAGICLYNVGAAALLATAGALGGMNGLLLWPAVGLHGLVGAAMLWVILGSSRAAPRTIA